MYIADLHIHSRFSRATSKEGDAPHLDLWAGRKGIGLVGTGDFTHPAWRAELQEMLTPAEEGFYTLKPQYRLAQETAGTAQPPRFVLTGEISSIYKKNGRVRKVHNLILLPSFQAAEELSRRLERVGNIHSDGRPILGLDSRDLLELTLTACPEAVFIPAHIWTPHFSLFGAFSGFQTMEECFEDLTPHIHAVETGLSSDPPMNWQVSALDGYTLVSNSDAHSPQKLGREANLLDCGLSYPALKHAIETGEGFGGTIEFFPEEGKYHLDGHRNCGVCLTPQEAESLGGLCPVCGKKLTIGVQHRVEELADRPLGQPRPNQKPFESLAPLPEVIAACTGSSETSKKTQARYQAMLQQLGSEFHILLQAGFEDIQRVAGPAVAEGIRRLRLGQVERVPGYDGAFGHVVLLTPAEREALEGQTSLFGAAKAKAPKRGRPAAPKQSSPKKEQAPSQPTAQLNPEQRRAAEWTGPAVAVVAGPGTGKTKTLTARILHLLGQGAAPGEITAVTFTRRAAGEMEERLAAALGGKSALRGLTVATFHAICHDLLGRPPLLSREESLALAESVLRDGGQDMAPGEFLRQVSQVKNSAVPLGSSLPPELYQAYQAALARRGAMDFGGQPDRPPPLSREEALALAEAVLRDGGQDMAPGEFLRQVSQVKNSAVPLGSSLPPELYQAYQAALARRGAMDFGGQPDRPPPLSREEALALAEAVLRDGGQDMAPGEFLRQVAQVKNSAAPQASPLPPELFQAYQAALARRGAMDFDDLLLRAAEQELTPGQRRRFTHLLIDEFQDSNPLQLELICRWSQKGESLFVIGDPDQSIYGFRGADSGCFEKLRQRFPQLETLRLVKNYRSTPQVLGCAMPVIAHNPGPARDLEPQAPAGPPVRVLQGEDDLHQAAAIAKEIARMTGGMGMAEAGQDRSRERYRSFSDVGVLCRTHRQAQLVERCLRRDSIPCQVTGREDLLQRREARGMLAFLQAVRDPADTAALSTCLELVWDCLPETISAVVDLSRAAGGWDRAFSGDSRAFLGEFRAVSGFFQAAQGYFQPLQTEKPLALLTRWEGERGPFPGLEQLKNMAVFYPTTAAFLDALLLGEEADLRRGDGQNYASGAVQVMTLHAAKGLEFPVVFLPFLDQGSLPLESEHRPADIGEERRLFYVGITRAQEELVFLCGPQPSPFLAELPPGCAAWEHLPSRQPTPEQLSFF